MHIWFTLGEKRQKQNGMDEHVIFFLIINSKTWVLNKIIPGVQLGSTIKKRELGDFGDRTWRRFEQESGFEFELFEPSKLASLEESSSKHRSTIPSRA